VINVDMRDDHCSQRTDVKINRWRVDSGPIRPLVLALEQSTIHQYAATGDTQFMAGTRDAINGAVVMDFISGIAHSMKDTPLPRYNELRDDNRDSLKGSNGAQYKTSHHLGTAGRADRDHCVGVG
jgi:hypothetical protein